MVLLSFNVYAVVCSTDTDDYLFFEDWESGSAVNSSGLWGDVSVSVSAIVNTTYGNGSTNSVYLQGIQPNNYIEGKYAISGNNVTVQYDVSFSTISTCSFFTGAGFDSSHNLVAWENDGASVCGKWDYYDGSWQTTNIDIPRTPKWDTIRNRYSGSSSTTQLNDGTIYNTATNQEWNNPADNHVRAFTGQDVEGGIYFDNIMIWNRTIYGDVCPFDVIISNIDVYGDTTEPYDTKGDVTPTITFDTNKNAWCRISDTDEDFTSMTHGTCTSGDGTQSHTCTLPVNQRLSGELDNVYVGCNDTLNNFDTAPLSALNTLEMSISFKANTTFISYLPSPENVTAYYSLDICKGLDGTRRYNASTLSGVVNITGEISGACFFDGVNDYITRDFIPVGTERSVSFWIKKIDDSDVQVPFNLGDDTGTAANNVMVFYTSVNSNTFTFRVGNGTATKTITTTVDINEWTFITGVYNSTNLLLYKDGDFIIDSIEFLNGLTTGNIFSLGNYRNNNQFPFNGTIDEVTIYNKALSSGEVSTIYNRRRNTLSNITATAVGIHPSRTNVSFAYSWWVNNSLVAESPQDNKNLPFYFPFDYGNRDYSNSYDLIFQNGLDINSTFKKVGDGSLNLDGLASSFAYIPNTANNFETGNFTVGAWIYATNSSASVRLASIIGHFNWGLFYEEDNIEFFIRDNASGFPDVVKLGAYYDGWHFLVGQYVEEKYLVLWIDGEYVDYQDITQLIIEPTYGTRNIQIGDSSHGVAREYQGKIDDIFFINKTLSNETIKRMYLAGVGDKGAELISNLTRKHDNVTVEITPIDYLSWGQGVNSSKLLIENIEPTWIRDIDNVTLNEDFENYTSVFNLTLYVEDFDVNETIDFFNFTIEGQNTSQVKCFINTTNNVSLYYQSVTNWFSNETNASCTVGANDGDDIANFTVYIDVLNVNDNLTLDQDLANKTIEVLFNYVEIMNCIDIDQYDTISYYDNASKFDINISTGLVNYTTVGIFNETIEYICGDGTVNISQLISLGVVDTVFPSINLIVNTTDTNLQRFVFHNFSWKSNDTYNLSRTWFGTNDTGSWVNFTAVNIEGNTFFKANYTYNVTANSSSNVGFCSYVNDTSDNTNRSCLDFVIKEITLINPPNGTTDNNLTQSFIFLSSRKGNCTLFHNLSGTFEGNESWTNISANVKTTMYVRMTEEEVYQNIIWNVNCSYTDQDLFALDNFTFHYDNKPPVLSSINLTTPFSIVEPYVTDDTTPSLRVRCVDDFQNCTGVRISNENKSFERMSTSCTTSDNFEYDCTLDSGDVLTESGSIYLSANDSLNNFHNFSNNNREVRITLDNITPVGLRLKTNSTFPSTGDWVNLSVFWTDNLNISSAWFGWDDEGTWVNFTAQRFSIGGNHSANHTINVTSLFGRVNYCAYANDTRGNENSTCDTLYIATSLIVLNNPLANFTNDTDLSIKILFNCSTLFNTTNLSLYITDNFDENFAFNTTFSFNTSSLTNESINLTATWNLTLGNGDFTWSCLGFNTSGNEFWGEGRSILINTSGFRYSFHPNISKLVYAPNWSLLNWSVILNITNIISGNYSWNMNDENITHVNMSSGDGTPYLFKIENTGYNNISIYLAINQTFKWFEWDCNGMNITTSNSTMFHIPRFGSNFINCTLSLLNISQVYHNWSLDVDRATWGFEFNFTINDTGGG